MTNYKILAVTPHFPPDSGGIANHVFNLNINLVKQGNKVSIIAPKGIREQITELEQNFDQVFRLSSFYFPGWPYPTMQSMSIPLKVGKEIQNIMKNGSFDFIHVHGHHYPISWIAINAAKKFGIPCVLTMHGMYALNPNVKDGRTKIEDYFNKYYFTKILAKTTAVIGTTEIVLNYAKKFGKDSIEYFKISNGVNTLQFKDNLKRKAEYRRKYNIDNDKLVILFRGRFEHVKGVIEFAKAAIKIIKNKNIEIILLGGGPLESSVKEILNGIDRIHILGWQPLEQIHELYIASDIFVMPSRLEAQGITVIEAMQAGLHIVYSPIGGIPETVEGYSAKTQLNEVSVNEIHKVLTDLISNFSKKNNFESSNSNTQNFDWSHIATETCKVYEACLK